MGNDRYLPMGSKDNYEGLSVAVCVMPPHFTHIIGSGRVSSHPAGGNLFTVTQRSDLCRPTQSLSERFLLQVLLVVSARSWTDVL